MDHRQTEHDHSVMDSLHKALTQKPTSAASATEGPQGRRTNSVYVKHFGNSVNSRTVFNHYDNLSKKSQLWKRQGTVTLDGNQIAELFRLRPELSEYCFMEIENAQLSDL